MFQKTLKWIVLLTFIGALFANIAAAVEGQAVKEAETSAGSQVQSTDQEPVESPAKAAASPEESKTVPAVPVMSADEKKAKTEKKERKIKKRKKTKRSRKVRRKKKVKRPKKVKKSTKRKPRKLKKEKNKKVKKMKKAKKKVKKIEKEGKPKKKKTKVKKIKKEGKPKEKAKKVSFKKFIVYEDAGRVDNNFIPTGWMGDYGDIKLTTKCFIKPKKGMTCIKIYYSAKQTQGIGWAGVYWQHPAHNWGDKKEGFDLSEAKKLIFYARGDRGGEIIDIFKVGGIKGQFPDSTESSIGPIMLTKKWKKYIINLKGKNLSHIIGGFAWVATTETNPDGMIFYLDELRFE
ncbi:hypothetical protein ACFL4O_02830 [bacterium]